MLKQIKMTDIKPFMGFDKGNTSEIEFYEILCEKNYFDDEIKIISIKKLNSKENHETI